MKVSLISTSIRVPDSLTLYTENIKAHGHRDVDLIVVGDRSSPPALKDFCARIHSEFLPCTYLDVEAQRRLLADRSPELWKHLRFDSRQRRNIGFLEAWCNGADVVVSIDPRDEPGPGDFLGAHLQILQSTTGLGLAPSTSWFNQAALLEEANQKTFSLRGFPIALPKAQRIPTVTPIPKPVAANSGFCLAASDLDAATKLQDEIHVTGPQPQFPPHLRLSTGAWAPFPVHNLAMRRELIPAYFLSPFVGRYDDIWAGWIITRIAHHLGQCISFGQPCVHRSSRPTDLQIDFEQELVGYRQSIRFAEALRSIPLQGRSFHECMGEIAAQLAPAWPELPRTSGIEIEGRNQLITGLKLWHEMFAHLQATSTADLLGRVAQESPSSPLHQVVGQTP